jgi:hypothetical protein
MTQETRAGRFVDYQRFARLVSQEAVVFPFLSSRSIKHNRRKSDSYLWPNAHIMAVAPKAMPESRMKSWLGGTFDLLHDLNLWNPLANGCHNSIAVDAGKKLQR